MVIKLPKIRTWDDNEHPAALRNHDPESKVLHCAFVLPPESNNQVFDILDGSGKELRITCICKIFEPATQKSPLFVQRA